MAGRGKQRTSFGKRERERKRQEKQAAKRARRHHDGVELSELSEGTDVGEAERPEPLGDGAPAGLERDD